jgi:hypothetical protein
VPSARSSDTSTAGIADAEAGKASPYTAADAGARCSTASEVKPAEKTKDGSFDDDDFAKFAAATAPSAAPSARFNILDDENVSRS